jgi:hypothetical protein
MEICGALCDGVVILVVAQQEVDIRGFPGVNLGDWVFASFAGCCRRVSVGRLRLLVLRGLQQIGKG